MNRRPDLKLLRACAAVAAAALLAGTAAAQEEPLVIGGQRQQRQNFAFERPSASMSLQGLYSQSTSGSPNGPETRTTETIYQEILSMATRGFILSPTFVDLNLAASFGLEQTSIDSNAPAFAGEDGKGDEQTYEYDLMARILQLSSAPLTLFARRTEEIVTQPFGLSYQSAVDSYGAAWQIKHETLPTSLRYQHIAVEQTTLGGQLDFASTEDILGWTTSWRPSSSQQLTWDYSFSTSQSEGGLEEDEQRHDASLTHSLVFGKDNRSRLESALQYYSETDNNFSHDRLRLHERMTLRHSDTFETRYFYDLTQFTYGATETTSHRGSAAFTHWLYRSLVTSGGLMYAMTEANDSQTTEWIANLSLDYTKKVPLGTFFSTFTTSYSQQTAENRADDLIVLDQPVTFSAFQPVLIPQQSLVPGSIRITQRRPGGEELFVPGIDYTVTPVPGGVELRRVGTNLPAGEPVLVDYVVAPQDANETGTSVFALSARYSIEEGWLRNLSPYARYLVQQQEISAEGPNAPLPNDVTSYTIGADYRIWHLQFRAEHEVVDSTLLPYETTRLRVDWAQDLGPDLRASAGIEQTLTTYTDEGTETEATNIIAAVDYRLSRYLWALARASWINQTDTVSGVIEGWDQEVGLRWRYRQTSVHGSVRHTSLTTEDMETDNMIFQVGFERRF